MCQKSPIRRLDGPIAFKRTGQFQLIHWLNSHGVLHFHFTLPFQSYGNFFDLFRKLIINQYFFADFLLAYQSGRGYIAFETVFFQYDRAFKRGVGKITYNSYHKHVEILSNVICIH